MVDYSLAMFLDLLCTTCKKENHSVSTTIVGNVFRDLKLFIIFTFCVLVELIDPEDPLLSYFGNAPMDALLAVEVTPDKEYLLCFDGQYVI